MKSFLLLLLLMLSIDFSFPSSEKCEKVTQEDCENMTSEYEKYRECMERRTKRSADCYNEVELDCNSCDCDSCSYSSCDSCKNDCCNQCCDRSSCKTYNCCHQLCRAECRSNSCRTACKKKCQNRPTSIREQVVKETRSSNQQHNITTVIHLNNVINNTNLINLPISLNNTVLNNITNTGEYSGRSSYGIRESTRENCCLTVGPRQCIPQSTFPFMRCFHVRRRNCGSICTAPVVHYQTHEVCDNDVSTQQSCHQQIVYVPQPQPRCAYHSEWPYVTCGNQETQSCEGCYGHYIKREDVTKCSNFCYDDGYGLGPYYRKGPFYRPGFAHAPSCYQTGTCDAFNGYYGYGYDNIYEGGLPENGFPGAYPPQTYPFIIEDCKNCTFVDDVVTTQEPPFHLSYKNLETINQNFPSDKIVNIESNVEPSSSGKYAEIRIKKDKEVTTTAVPESTTI